ncbi:MAG: nitroreductase family protein, partial [Ignavibacteriales bacterium]|nr:nitroreductase family protein [Ignavibacteriales bacterium]
ASIETDLTIAMDHMILTAESEGVGTCWIAAFNEKILREALELKDNEVVYAITPLGYQNDGFKKRVEKDRKSFNEVIKFL